MPHLYLIPGWFFGIDVFLEFIFAFVSAMVSYYAFKIYNISQQRGMRILGSGFLLISASYIIKGFINLFILHENSESLQFLEIANLNSIQTVGVYIHFILFIAGLVTLAYLTFGILSKRAYTLLMLTNLAVLIASPNTSLAFYLLSTLLIAYIITHYLLIYIQNKRALTFLVLIGFISLLLSQVGLIFTDEYYPNYFFSHGLEFLAYVFFILSLVLSTRTHNEKKNKA